MTDDRLATVLRYCEDHNLGGDEPPWIEVGSDAIAVPFGLLDDTRLGWDEDALVIQTRRYRPVHVDYLHRYVICQP